MTKSFGILDLLSQTVCRSCRDLESCCRTLGHISWAVANIPVTLLLMWSDGNILIHVTKTDLYDELFVIMTAVQANKGVGVDKGRRKKTVNSTHQAGKSEVL